jgi:hypothetical protein
MPVRLCERSSKTRPVVLLGVLALVATGLLFGERRQAAPVTALREERTVAKCIQVPTERLCPSRHWMQ